MANTPISDLNGGVALTTPAAGDLLAIVDVSDTTEAPTGTTKSIAVSDLVTGAVVPDDSVTNAKLANMATQTIKGRTTAGTGDPEDLSATQATAILNAMVGDSGSGGTKGLVPAPGSGDAAAGKFLKADGTFAVPATGGSGGIGDVVGPGSSTDNALVRFDSITGKLIQNSTVTLDDTGAITVPEMAAPSTPGANKVALYAKSDGLLYSKDDAGTETLVSGGAGGGGSIAPLVVEDANTIAQRNSTNPQNFNVYGTFTDSSNYRRLRMGWTVTAAEFMSEALGTGSPASNIVFKVGSGTSLSMGTGSLVPSADNTFVLGSSSAYFNEIYNATWVTRSGGALRWANAARLKSPADGILNLTDDSGNSGSGTFRFDNRTPSQITSDQNNYSVPVTGYFIRLSSNASRNITGLTFGGGGVGDGQVHLLVNVGTNPIVLKHDDASSTAANRFYCSTGADITLTSTSTAKEAADVIYDNTLQRWLVYKR